MLSSSEFRPTLVRQRAASICFVGLSALVSGGSGTVLALGDPLRSDAPTLTAIATASVLAAIVLLHARRLAPSAWLAFAIANLLIAIPLIGLSIAILANDELAQLTTRSSALGWVLAATLPLVAAIAANYAHGSKTGIDLAFGGMVGVSGAVLLHVAAASDSPFSPLWALTGFAAGLIVIGGMSWLPPRPVQRTPVGTAWRSFPCAAAYFMAIIAAVPAAPRHELATSVGTQVLAATIAGCLLVLSFALWRADSISASVGQWNGFRIVLRGQLPAITALALLIIGGLQAASYSAVTIDDLGRFVVAAETLASKLEFPFWGDYWLLPGMPVFLTMAFALLGYTYPAALAPMFVANTLLPWLIYRASIALGARRAPAFALAVLAVILPPIQIYSLGSAEPDPVFIALLAGSVWAFAHVIRSRHPRHSLLALGAIAAVLTATRPEGPLYGAILVLGSLLATRSRWAIVGSMIFGLLLLPLVVYSLVRIGQPWPTPREAFSFDTLIHNSAVIGEITLPRLSKILLLHDFRFPLIIAAIVALFILGAIRTSRQHWALAALPCAAILNVVISLSIVDSATTEVRVTLIEDFVRHRAYPTPIVAALSAIGVTAFIDPFRRSQTLRTILLSVGVASAVYLTAGSLYILGKPEGIYHVPRVASLLPADVHVHAPELWLNPFKLPEGDGDFMGYRSNLVAWYRPFDTHGNTTGMAYQTLTGAVAAFGFASILAAAPQRRSRSAQRGV
ncbi:MAG: hypothetical protein OXP73_01700 [Chloroflexota bacterium]|nr:hypothetical protein [Chloroflexota bacterium]